MPPAFQIVSVSVTDMLFTLFQQDYFERVPLLDLLLILSQKYDAYDDQKYDSQKIVKNTMSQKYDNQKYDEIRSRIRFLILSPCYLFALLKKKSKIRQKYDGQKYD